MELSYIKTFFTAAGGLVAAMGGWEAVKYFLNRKSNARKAEAEADSADFQVLRDTSLFLQEQLKEKEVRFAEQTDLVRRLNAEVLELTRQKGQLEMELQRYKCVVKLCPNREPQNGY